MKKTNAKKKILLFFSASKGCLSLSLGPRGSGTRVEGTSSLSSRLTEASWAVMKDIVNKNVAICTKRLFTQLALIPSCVCCCLKLKTDLMGTEEHLLTREALCRGCSTRSVL